MTPFPDSCGELLRALCYSGPASRGLAEVSLMDTRRKKARRPGVGILSHVLHSVLGLQSKAFCPHLLRAHPEAPDRL